MNRYWYCILIALCALFASCTEPSRSFTGPTPLATPGTQPPIGSFTLTGTVRKEDGTPLPGVTVQTEAGRSTVSDTKGHYTFTDIGGVVRLKVSADGYVDWTTTVYVASDVRLDIRLESSLMLVPGTTLRGIVSAPPCDVNWDASAPCQRIYF